MAKVEPAAIYRIGLGHHGAVSEEVCVARMGMRDVKNHQCLFHITTLEMQARTNRNALHVYVCVKTDVGDQACTGHGPYRG